MIDVAEAAAETDVDLVDVWGRLRIPKDTGPRSPNEGPEVWRVPAADSPPLPAAFQRATLRALAEVSLRSGDLEDCEMFLRRWSAAGARPNRGRGSRCALRALGPRLLRQRALLDDAALLRGGLRGLGLPGRAARGGRGHVQVTRERTTCRRWRGSSFGPPAA